MKFAVIGDIHGNIYALKAVYKDIQNKNVDFIISTGDLVGYMMYPNEVIEFLKENKITSIQGNHDKFIANGDKIKDISIYSLEEVQKNASELYTNSILKDENRSFLKNLPKEIRIKKGDFDILIVHGSPRKIDEYLYEDGENIKEIEKTYNENVIISGHTHIPYIQKVINRYFINAGSVGKPKHGNPKSTYVIIEVKEDLKCTIEEVNYEYEKMIEDIKNNNGISDKLIPLLKNGF